MVFYSLFPLDYFGPNFSAELDTLALLIMKLNLKLIIGLDFKKKI